MRFVLVSVSYIPQDYKSKVETSVTNSAHTHTSVNCLSVK